MAVTAKLYGLVFKSAFNKEIDFDSDTIKMMLCTSSYTPNQDTHQYKSSVTNEITGSGYSAGGATVGSCTVAYDSSTNTLKLDANDVAWTSATFTARIGVLYNSTPGSDATRPLIGYVDFGADMSPSSGTLTVAWDSNGIANVVVA